MTATLHTVNSEEPRTIVVNKRGKRRVALSDKLGNCYTDTLQITDGLMINQLYYCPQYRLSEQTLSPHTEPVMVITIGLQGTSEFHSKNTETVQFTENKITITTFSGIEGMRHYQSEKTVSQLRLIMTKDFLTHYFDQQFTNKFFNKNVMNKILFQDCSPTSKNHALILAHVLQQNNNDPQQALKTHINALSLLADQMQWLLPDLQNTRLTYQEIQTLEKAKSLMLSRFSQAITINYIASSVGMNIIKFKKCFTEYYGLNPVDYLLQIRMQQAIILLESGLQVSQVAWQVGYQYPNNFTVAFSRFYGKSPKTMFKANAG